jgi:hypothetical protein
LWRCSYLARLWFGPSACRRHAKKRTRQSFEGTGFHSNGHNITDDPTNDGFLTGPKDDFGGGFTGIVRGTLAFNQGGKTRTYAVSAGSRAIGGGDLLAGFTRNQNGAAWLKGPSDVGSF